MNICTITTASHLFKVYALADSLSAYPVKMHVLVVDEVIAFSENDRLKFYSLSQVSESELAQKIIHKYQNSKDKLRWGMKSVFLNYLLQQSIEKLIYVDNDIYFYQSPEVIFQSFNNSDILLTPHFYPSDPTKHQNWLEANYRVGLYNAGFIGVTKEATQFLNWWTECCLYNMKKSYWRGLFDDQKYLDLVPIKFENVKVLKNRGLNFAGWNCDFSEENSPIHYNEIVFVHFANLTLELFSKPTSYYYDLFQEYNNSIMKYKSNSALSEKKIGWRDLDAAVYYLKWKIMRLLEK